MSESGSKKSIEQEYADHTHGLLLQITDLMERAAKDGLVINFGISTDFATKKSTISGLTVARSYV